MLKFALLVISVLGISCENVTGEIIKDDFYTPAMSPRQAVEGLIKRLLPDHVEHFTINIDISLKNNHKDVFILQRAFPDDPLTITASSGVATAAGLHHFLKYFCKSHISWDFHQLNMTQCLKLKLYEKIFFNDRYRYYQNACTPSYSFVWWDWKKWEEHIDWMAMQGFNLVPAQNGQEEIWRRVYHQLGLTREEIDEQFAGPAFLAWNRMGNLRGWGGPLSSSWHKKQLELNKKIIKRMREFGMEAVLPAFAGQVPRGLQRLYPNDTYYVLPRWNRFNDSYCCPLLLNPTGDLFKKISRMFLTEIIKEFGTDHHYSCDTFNEMTPFTTDLTQLAEIGAAIYSSMSSIDSEATWLMQGWLFHHEFLYWTKSRAKALLTSVPSGKMIILDLQSEQNPQYERLDNYFGQPYIWCMLHNFGGTLSMFGSAEIINNNVFQARNAKNSTLIGTGITPEGIDQNYVIYDLMSEMSYRKEAANLEEWFGEYATRRYGFENANISAAWNILRKTVYDFKGLEMMRGKFAYNRSPRVKIPTWTWYHISNLSDAQQLFFEELPGAIDNKNFYHDYVDVSRQLLQDIFDNYFQLVTHFFLTKDLDFFLLLKDRFLHLFDTMEDILSTDEKWLLGKWLSAAKRAAGSGEEAILFEYNARNQITLWGPTGEIMDYANKQWSGIVKDFFKPRWELFLTHMEDSLRHGVKFNERGARQDVFEKVEEPFTFASKEYPEKPREKSIEKLKEIQGQIVGMMQNATMYSEERGKTMLNRKKKRNQRRN